METRLAIQIWLVRTILVALPVLLWLSRRAIRHFFRDVTRATWCTLFGIVLVSLAVRAVGGLWSVAHENALAYILLEDAAALDHLPSYHGVGGHVLYHALLHVFGHSPRSVISANFLLSGLTPLLVFAVGWGLWREAGGSLLAATLLAVNPCHARMGPTEALHVPMLFFGLLGLAALLVALHDRRWPAPAFLAALAFAFAAQVRPLGALLAVPAVLCVLTHRSGVRAAVRRWDLWAAFGVVVVAMAPRIYELLALASGAGAEQLGFFRLQPDTILSRLFVPAQHAFIDHEVTPVVLQLFAMFGILALALSERRSLVVLLTTWLVHTYFNTTHGENPVDQLRFHMGTLPWAVLLAGATARVRLLIRGEERRSWRVAALVTLIALPIPGLMARRDVLTARYDQQQEFDFFAEAMGALPDEAVIVHLDRFTAGRELTTELPRSWLRANGKLSETIPASVFLARSAGSGGEGSEGAAPDPEGERPVLWYRGVTCWSFVPHVDFAPDREAPGGRAAPDVPGNPLLRPLCREVESRWRTEALAERSFPSRPDRFFVPAPRITIGFYRLREPRP